MTEKKAGRKLYLALDELATAVRAVEERKLTKSVREALRKADRTMSACDGTLWLTSEPKSNRG